jgi:hypothetical protein
MARPRSGREKGRPKHLGFRVATWVHDAVHRLAAEQNQPASEIAHELLEIALGRLGIKPPRAEFSEAPLARAHTRTSSAPSSSPMRAEEAERLRSDADLRTVTRTSA